MATGQVIVVSEPKNIHLLLSQYGSINELRVPQKLNDILPKLVLNGAEWNDEIRKMLQNPLSRDQMNEVLKKPPNEFTPTEVIMAFLWFFRDTFGCNDIEAIWKVGTKGISIIQYLNILPVLYNIFC